MDDCIFCDIPVNQRDRLVFENVHAYGIFSPTPAVFGQAIIAPKGHVTDVRQLSGQRLEDYVHAVPKTFEEIRKMLDSQEGRERLVRYYLALNEYPRFSKYALHMLSLSGNILVPQGYNTGTNDNEFAGQSQPHIHTHLFPRTVKGDGIVAMVRNFVR